MASDRPAGAAGLFLRTPHSMTDPDTPDIADRVTVRLGPLRPLLARRLARTGQTASEYVRQVMANDLGVDPPEMPGGNPDIGLEAARRWERHRRGNN